MPHMGAGGCKSRLSQQQNCVLSCNAPEQDMPHRRQSHLTSQFQRAHTAHMPDLLRKARSCCLARSLWPVAGAVKATHPANQTAPACITDAPHVLDQQQARPEKSSSGACKALPEMQTMQHLFKCPVILSKFCEWGSASLISGQSEAPSLHCGCLAQSATSTKRAIKICHR